METSEKSLARVPGQRCPTCESPDPKLHPAMQWEGEVQPCRDAWHIPSEHERRKAPDQPPVAAGAEEPLGTALPRPSGTIKATLTGGGRGKPLEYEDETAGATWELVDSLEKSLKAIEYLSSDLGYDRGDAGINGPARNALALIATARKAGGA